MHTSGLFVTQLWDVLSGNGSPCALVTRLRRREERKRDGAPDLPQRVPDVESPSGRTPENEVGPSEGRGVRTRDLNVGDSCGRNRVSVVRRSG